jgi:hypothetical protein
MFLNVCIPDIYLASLRRLLKSEIAWKEDVKTSECRSAAQETALLLWDPPFITVFTRARR